jgi:hypothetical protein
MDLCGPALACLLFFRADKRSARILVRGMGKNPWLKPDSFSAATKRARELWQVFPLASAVRYDHRGIESLSN